MAQVLFVRHGQASFGKKNYDELSSLGHRQTKLCGEFLFSHIIKPDHKVQFISGELKRQQQSMDNILLGSPDHLTKQVQVLPGLNEFDHDNVLAVANAHYESRENFMAHMLKQDDPKKFFHKCYVQAVQKWLEEPENKAYNESFNDFNKRVMQAYEQILAQCESGETVVVTSSAGPISICLQQALGLDGQGAFALNDVMSNASISRILLNQSGRVSLSYFNNGQYLQAAGCEMSYR